MNERELIERYNDAWNAHDLDAIASMHAPDIVFHNYSANERAEGADAVCEHIAQIFRNSPDLINVRVWSQRLSLHLKDAEENELLIEARRLYLKRIEQSMKKAETPVLRVEG